MKTNILFLSLLTIPLLATGCASIIDESPCKTIRINSNPEGAKVTLTAANGTEVLAANTPVKIKLERATGYFRGADYKITFEKSGYCPYEAHVDSQINPWYFGNIAFGGIIGMFLVDPTTGCMYTLSPSQLNCKLVPAGAPAAATTSASLKSTQGN